MSDGTPHACKRIRCESTQRGPSVTSGTAELLHLPEDILQVIALKLDTKSKGSLRRTCRQLRTICNKSTTTVLLEYGNRAGLSDCPPDRVKYGGEAQHLARASRNCSPLGIASLLLELKKPPLPSLLEQAECPEGTVSQSGWRSTVETAAKTFYHANKAVVCSPPGVDYQCFGSVALQELSMLNLSALKLKPHLPPHAFSALSHLPRLQSLELRRAVLPSAEQLRSTLERLPHLRKLHLAGMGLHRMATLTMDDQDIWFKAQHLSAIAQSGCPLLDLELKGFKYHGSTESWETGLSTLSALQGLTRLSLVSRPRHLGPQLNISSCALLNQVSRLPNLKELCLHVGYCMWCGAQQICSTCSLSHGKNEAQRAAHNRPVAPPFPALESMHVYNGYGFNMWAGSLCKWLVKAPKLKTVALAMYVVDIRLQELAILSHVEIHLRWLLPYSLERLLPLTRLPNLTTLSLDTARKGVMLRDGRFLSSLTTLTRLEFLGQAAWDDPMEPNHYLAPLSKLAVKCVPPYLSSSLDTPEQVMPLLNLCKQKLHGTIGGVTFEGPPTPTYAITLERVASWGPSNQWAIYHAGGVGVVMQMVAQEFSHLGPHRLTGCLVHWLATLTFLSNLKAACEELVPKIGVLFKVLDHCLGRGHRGPLRHALAATDLEFEVINKCKGLALEVLKNLVMVGGYTEAVALYNEVSGIDMMVRLITRRGSDATKAVAAALLGTFGQYKCLRKIIIERGGINALWKAVETMQDAGCKQQAELALHTLNVYD